MDTRMLDPPIKGKRCFEIQGTFVTVDERYQVQNMIGCGAYGVVYSAYDS
jgi:serine/threonine protein kinase